MAEHDIKYEKTITEAVEEINERKTSGKKVHTLTEEGMKAIDVANMIVGTIMKRNQPDVSFFKVYMNSTNDRLGKMSGKKKAANEGRKSLRRKRSNRVNDSKDSS